jgi:signal transduction histidine kinase
MTPPTAKPKTSPKPTFFWQGVLILLPVAVLAAVALYSLNQDRLVVRHEATERAQAIADDLLDTLWQRLASSDRQPERPEPSAALITYSPANPDKSDPRLLSIENPSFTVNASGQLLSPAPYSGHPVPQPLDLNLLTADQRRLWQAIALAESSRHPALVQSCRDFIALHPPARFAALAHYALALALSQSGDTAAARDTFATLLANHPDATGESGLALAPLVLVKQFELTPPGSTNRTRESFAQICQQLLIRPSPLTPQLLRHVETLATNARMKEAVVPWQLAWNRDELARQLHSAWAAQLQTSAARIVPAPLLLAAHPPAPSPVKDGESSPSLLLLVVDPGQPLLPAGTNFVADSPGPAKWIAARAPATGEAQRYFCRPAITVARETMKLIRGKSQFPPYFGVSVDVAGEPLVSDSNFPLWYELGGGPKGGGYQKSTLDPATFHAPVLATARSIQAGDNQLVVKVHLTNADAMYASQNARTLRYGTLISVAALAALVGFGSARRAFYRQQHLNEMKDNFVSSVSHELRAPIASVRLMAENLEQGRVPDAPRQNEYYRFIGQECRRLSSLIENVLDFSRIEQGRKEYEFEPAEVAALVRQTVKLMEPVAAQAGVTLTLEVNDAALHQLPAPPVLDAQAVQQALINLIDNAIKHSPRDATVAVSLALAGSRLRFTVADRGEGIPAEDHTRIFERFYRRGSELRRETQGIGIGLSIVKHVVDAHGGSVTVDSQPGQGSRFFIDLPLQPPRPSS